MQHLSITGILSKKYVKEVYVMYFIMLVGIVTSDLNNMLINLNIITIVIVLILTFQITCTFMYFMYFSSQNNQRV